MTTTLLIVATGALCGIIGYWWGRVNQLYAELNEWQDERNALMAESCNRNCAKRRPRDEDCKNQLMAIGLDAFKDALGESKPDEPKDNTCSDITCLCEICHAVSSCPERDDKKIACADYIPENNFKAVTESNKEAAESVEYHSAGVTTLPFRTKPENPQQTKALDRCASTKKAAQKSIGMTEDEAEVGNDIRATMPDGTTRIPVETNGNID